LKHSYQSIYKQSNFLVQEENTSEKRKKNEEEGRKRSKEDYDDINYEIFRTGDGLAIGVKLLVVYKVEDPLLTLKELNHDQILNHIEGIVVADMGYVIQTCSSVDFLRSNRSQDDDSKFKNFFGQLQKSIGDRLCDDFGKYGIQLIRLNIEAPKVLDKVISSKLSEFSVLNTETKTKQTMLEMQMDITQQEARRDAIRKEILQKQENDNKISTAKAQLESSRLIAEAKIVEAEAEAKKIELMQEMKNQKGEIYENYPSLLQYDLQLLSRESMENVSNTLISPDVARQYFGFPQQSTTDKVSKY